MGAHFCRHFRNSSRLCCRPKGNGAPLAGRAIHHPAFAPALPSAYRVDLLVGRKPAGLLLRKGEPAIDGNLKHPADPGHQLDIGAVFLLQPIPRTEGTRFIVSRFAPLDSDFHRSSSGPQRWCSSTTRLPQLPGAPPERAMPSLSVSKRLRSPRHSRRSSWLRR